MVLIRIIVLKGLLENVRIFAKHVPGELNGLADSLSREKFTVFHRLCAEQGRKFNQMPTPVPEAIWPVQKLWKS